MKTLQQRVDRLARAMAICQVAMDQGAPAPLFALQVAALESAVADVKDGLEREPDAFVRAPSPAIGPSTADLLADALFKPAPDTPEGLT